MMALVAYSDDSDLGSDSEDVEEKMDSIKNEPNTKIPLEIVSIKNEPNTKIPLEIVSIKNEPNTKIPLEIVKEKTPSVVHSYSPKIVELKQKSSSGIDNIVDEDDDEGYVRDKPSILASIPAALPLDNTLNNVAMSEVEDELTDVPTVDTWKVTAEIKKGGHDAMKLQLADSKSKAQSTFTKKKEKSKVKIFVPALSEFDDDEDEEEEKEEPERKKMKPSSKGTGLFSVLPEPKHIAVKETKRSLIPYVLTKAPSVQKPSKPKPALEKKTVVHSVDSEEDEDAGPSDFFSLSESPTDLNAVAVMAPPIADIQAGSKHIAKAQSVADDISSMSKEQMPPPQYVSHQEELPYSFQDQEKLSENPSNMDEEAMIRLMGKRRGGKGEAINFIDVNADDALLTRDEWMTKALSEEKPTHSFSKKKDGLPSQKQKQKHQITYLAHQAKERELELKNNWAQNRMTKMQTQAKYGF